MLNQYPAATHISVMEWLGLVAILATPVVLIGAIVYMLIRIIKG